MDKKIRKIPRKSVQVTWFGHSAFLVESPNGKRVLIDPWLDNPKAPEGAKAISAVQIILITHGHGDHIGNTIEVAQRTGATVIGIHEVSLYMKGHGIANAVGMNKGGTLQVTGVSITMVDALHSSGVDIESGVVCGGEAAGYVVQMENGYTLYHAGDTAVFSDMRLVRQLYKPDVAILPIGGLYTMGPREAALASQFVGAKHVIGMHYGTFPALAGTPDELRRYLPSRMKSKVVELVPGKAVMLT